VGRNVALDPLPLHRGAQRLTQRLMRAVPHRLRQRRPPARHLQHVHLIDPLVAEASRRLPEVLIEPVLARRCALVLIQEGVDELLQRDVGPIQRAESRLA
jgi:hypothetical protein